MYILDTDHISLLERASGQEYQRLRARLDQVPPSEIATTIISYEEQTQGWLTYLRKARKLTQIITAYERLNRHLDVYRPLRVIDFDENAATEFQDLRKLLRRINAMDLKIAAIVRGRGDTLLSRNLVHFRQVPGLLVEDWIG